MIHYAGFWRRFFASLIDDLILLLVSWGVVLLLGDWVPTARAQFFSVLIYFFVSIPYYITLQVKWGATPGKMLFKVRVCLEETAQSMTYQKALIRFIGYGISALPLGAGYLMAAFHPQKKALHDILAGTISIVKN